MPQSLNRYSVFVILLTSLLLAPGNVAAVTINKEQLFQVATLAARDGQYDKAEEFYKKVLEIDPRFAPAYNSLGMVYLSRGGAGSQSESMRYFKLSVDVDAAYVDGWNNLGRAYYSSGQFQLAEEALLKSLELRPDQTEIELMLGWVYLIGQSRAEHSLRYFSLALNKVDDDMAHYGVGLAHILLSNKFKVLEQITELRKRHREDLSLKLEAMVRNNVKISSTPGTPLVTGVDKPESVFDKQLQDVTAKGFDTNPKAKGIQVRIKGQLGENEPAP